MILAWNIYDKHLKFTPDIYTEQIYWDIYWNIDIYTHYTYINWEYTPTSGVGYFNM